MKGDTTQSQHPAQTTRPSWQSALKEPRRWAVLPGTCCTVRVSSCRCACGGRSSAAPHDGRLPSRAPGPSSEAANRCHRARPPPRARHRTPAPKPCSIPPLTSRNPHRLRSPPWWPSLHCTRTAWWTSRTTRRPAGRWTPPTTWRWGRTSTRCAQRRRTTRQPAGTRRALIRGTAHELLGRCSPIPRTRCRPPGTARSCAASHRLTGSGALRSCRGRGGLSPRGGLSRQPPNPRGALRLGRLPMGAGPRPEGVSWSR